MSIEQTEQVEQNTNPEIVEQAIENEVEIEAQGESEETPEVEGEEIAPEYAPKYKFKVRDEEHEMEEWVRDYIKDEETEKRFVDLFTAQKGIELAKKEREEYRGQFENLTQAVQHVSGLANEGKIGQFIDQLGLSKKAFIDYAIKELQYAELPEEQRREIDAQRQQQTQYEQQQMQQQTLQQQYEAQAVEMRKMELSNTLLRPEYAEAEKTYDNSVGTPGAFRQLVAQCGNYHWVQHNQDIGVERAVQEAMKLGRVQAEATPTQTGNVGTQSSPVQQVEKPVIPNLKAGGASPAKKGFKSIEEIRKYNAKRR